MAVRVQELPRDGNGAVIGMWRVYHANQSYTGQIGAVYLVEGVSLLPVFGKQLQIALSVFGGDLFIEPWTEDIPPGQGLPEGLTSEVPQAAVDALEVCPWKPSGVIAAPEKPIEVETQEDDPVEISDDLDDMSRDDLIVQARKLGLKPHWKTGADKLREMIRGDRS